MIYLLNGVSSGPAGLEPNAKTWEQLAEHAGFDGDKLAEAVGVSLRTLQRHFAKHYQTTVADWLRELQMLEALKRLRAGQTVKRTCYDLGFKQPSHFTRVFKEFYGTAPSVFLRRPLQDIAFGGPVPQALRSSFVN